jgi:hypothetical protein
MGKDNETAATTKQNKQQLKQKRMQPAEESLVNIEVGK